MKDKIAIVTNGGGMSCSYSAGAICALAEVYGLTEPDILVGSSGGAGTMAYFAAGQYSSIKNIWTNLLCTRKFISFWRIFKIMDIDYLIDEVMKKQDPLNTERVHQTKIDLFLSATEQQTGKMKFFSNRSSEDIFEVLRASKAIPIVYNRTVAINGIKYIDGEISAKIIEEEEKAIAEGATYVISVRNDKKNNTLKNFIMRTYFIFATKSLRKTIKNFCNGEICCHPYKNPSQVCNANIFYISPTKKLKIGLLDNRRQSLEEAFEAGYNDVKDGEQLRLFLEKAKENVELSGLNYI